MPDALRKYRPSSGMVLQILTTVPGLSSFSSHDFMILSSLYSRMHSTWPFWSWNSEIKKKIQWRLLSFNYEERERRFGTTKWICQNCPLKYVQTIYEQDAWVYIWGPRFGVDYKSIDYEYPIRIALIIEFRFAWISFVINYEFSRVVARWKA